MDNGELRSNTPADNLLYSVVKMEVRHREGIRQATGFWYKCEDRRFLITCRHVVANCETLMLTIPIRQRAGSREPNSPLKVTLKSRTDAWAFPEDESLDVATIPFSVLVESAQDLSPFRYVTVSNYFHPRPADVDEIDSIEEVIFLGYPQGLADANYSLPVTRRGITATPYWLDLNGQPLFLVDASVFGGSSGSPVYLYRTGMFHTRRERSQMSYPEFLFLGILSLRMLEQDLLKSSLFPASNAKGKNIGRESIDLGIVFKPAVIVESCRSHLEE